MEKNIIVKLYHDDNIFDTIDKINTSLSLSDAGVEFVFSNKECDGYNILYLVEKGGQ